MIKIASKTGFALRFLSTPWGMRCLILYSVRPCLALKREIIFCLLMWCLRTSERERETDRRVIDVSVGYSHLNRQSSLKGTCGPESIIHIQLCWSSFKHMHTLTQKWGNESCRLLALTVQMDRAKAFLSRHESPVTLQRPTSRPIVWETRAATVSVLRWMS